MRREFVLLVGGLLVACGGDKGGDGNEETNGAEGGIVSAGQDTESGDDDDDDDNAEQGGEGDDDDDDDDAADDGGGGIPKFDLGELPDVELGCGAGDGGGMGGATEFSYIWVANSPEGTVSKINTQTLIEEGRYLVRSDGTGSPSRTSVNLNGNVAVANRSGGVTKIFASPEDCPDPGNTSSGGADVKAWQDGCIGWFTPFTYNSQRPVAWTQGTMNNATCKHDNIKLWTSGANGNFGEEGEVFVILMDGETGEVEDMVQIPIPANYYGIYGAAVDGEGNFWGSQLSQNNLVRVGLDDMSIETWPMATSGYGMTVDPQGRAWTCSSEVARFTYATQTWDQTMGLSGNGGGCMVDSDGILWVAGYDNAGGGFNYVLRGVDTETLMEVATVPVPGYGKGISIDFEGYVWAVSTGADAYRVDVETGNIDTFTGLTSPYTYSDMTGFALSAAGSPAG